MITIFIIISMIVAVLVFRLKRKQVVMKREAYIRSYAFPRGMLDKVHKKHEHLTRKDLELASLGLRHFFLAYLKSDYQPISMPSQVVDDLWHEFILYTLKYQNFCKKAFGRFLHHSPATVLSDKKKSNVALRRCWQHVCNEEIINPLHPSRLPLLFALDAKLSIANGFLYMADCDSPLGKLGSNDGRVIYCGGDFSSKAFDGGTDGLSNRSGSGCSGGGCSSGCNSGCSNGCSGGCSGGCGGGGD